MSKLHSAKARTLHPHTLFRAFKYTIYCLLAFNIYLFFKEEYLASLQIFSDGIGFSQIIGAFSSTIDTFAWVLLLLIFELETAVIPDEKLKGGLIWALQLLKALAYGLIVYAFTGYVAKFGYVSATLPFAAADVCALIDQGFSWVEGADQYPALDAVSCLALQGQELLLISGTQIIGTAEAIRAVQHLGIVDIINSADWLIVVALLELEVQLQLRNLLTESRMLMFKYAKVFLYAVLFGCAIYWGFKGDFLDFWDAFLWLVAFIFIEMNIFQWHEEIEEEKLEELHQPDQVSA